MEFSFDGNKTTVLIERQIPSIDKIFSHLDCKPENNIIITDENVKPIAEKICDSNKIPFCTIKSGENHKNWQSVETIMSAALKRGLSKDSSIIGIGGGVICDLAGFAASVYMRGCRLILIPTTLLAMIDASIGGKTGFDIFGLKNFAGSFYPAELVFLPIECLSSLPQREWKSGIAELIKAAILDGDDFLDELSAMKLAPDGLLSDSRFLNCIEKAVQFKGKIVSEDFRDNGKRLLLNLGHTFAHALESSAGLGNLSHGEAVAWGIIKSCVLGLEMGITPPERAGKITSVLSAFGYDCSGAALFASTDQFLEAVKNDKKKRQNKFTFIVPDEHSARTVVLENLSILEKILNGGISQ
jgi:3-dehydroquinate synthase